jgi:hypothetical protein
MQVQVQEWEEQEEQEQEHPVVLQIEASLKRSGR